MRQLISRASAIWPDSSSWLETRIRRAPRLDLIQYACTCNATVKTISPPQKRSIRCAQEVKGVSACFETLFELCLKQHPQSLVHIFVVDHIRRISWL